MKKKLKKLVIFVMVTCLALTSVPFSTVNAEDVSVGYNNVLENGSFEEWNLESAPSAWNIIKIDEADSVTAQENSEVLMLNKTVDLAATRNPEVYQSITGLTGSVLDGTTVTQPVKYIAKAKVMIADADAKPVIDIRGNGKTSESDAAGNNYRLAPSLKNDYTFIPGEWQEIPVTTIMDCYGLAC